MKAADAACTTGAPRPGSGCAWRRLVWYRRYEPGPVDPLWSDDRTIDYRPRNGWIMKRE
jgi:hypothetical protein